MLDKNPQHDSEWIIIKNLFEENTLNSVLCSEPFVKTAFLSKVIQIINYPIIYLDFDLIYSGYVESKILPKQKNKPQRKNNQIKRAFDLNERGKPRKQRRQEQKREPFCPHPPQHQHHSNTIIIR